MRIPGGANNSDHHPAVHRPEADAGSVGHGMLASMGSASCGQRDLVRPADRQREEFQITLPQCRGLMLRVGRIQSAAVPDSDGQTVL